MLGQDQGGPSGTGCSSMLGHSGIDPASKDKDLYHWVCAAFSQEGRGTTLLEGLRTGEVTKLGPYHCSQWTSRQAIHSFNNVRQVGC